MTIEKMVRAVDLVLQLVLALEKQLGRQLCAVFSFVQRSPQRQRIKCKPNLDGVAVDLMN